eukprot:SAG11_NODE_6714_length_1261_cov_1.100688_1_plen_223_part_00
MPRHQQAHKSGTVPLLGAASEIKSDSQEIARNDNCAVDIEAAPPPASPPARGPRLRRSMTLPATPTPNYNPAARPRWGQQTRLPSRRVLLEAFHPPMSAEEHLTLSPFAKLKLYRRVPWKLSLELVLVVLALVQAQFYVDNAVPYFLDSDDAMRDIFFGLTNADGERVGAEVRRACAYACVHEAHSTINHLSLDSQWLLPGWRRLRRGCCGDTHAIRIYLRY